jgi:hypothetical protein
MRKIPLDTSSTYYLPYYEELNITCSTCKKTIKVYCNTDEQEVLFCSFCGDIALEISFEEEVESWDY